MSFRKTVEQKLYEAFMSNRGLQLTAEDVESLVQDEAVGTRITNQACYELGLETVGQDDVRENGPETWAGFLAYLTERNT